MEAEAGEAGEGEEPDEDLDYGTGFIYWKSELVVYEDTGTSDELTQHESDCPWVCRADLAVW